MDNGFDNWREVAESTWVRRTVIGLYVALLTGVIGAYIGVSLVEVQTSAYIRGGSTLQQGRPNAFRGVVLDAPTGTYRRRVKATFELRKPRDSEGDDGAAGDRAGSKGSDAAEEATPDGVELAEVEPRRNGVMEGAFDVPSDVEPGRYTLVLRVEGDRIEPFERATDVEVVEEDFDETKWLDATSRIVDESTREKSRAGSVVEQEGGLVVELLPPDGELVGGVGSTVYLRTSDAETGEPVPAEVLFEKLEGRAGWPNRDGPPASVETDRFGLAGFEVSAATDLRWTLEAKELGEGGDGSDGKTREGDEASDGDRRRGETVLQLYTVPAQMDLTLERAALVGDQKLRVGAETLFGQGEVLVDLFRGDDWLYAGAAPLRDRESNFALTIPEPVRPDSPAWFRVQVSRHVYGADETWDAAHFVAIPTGDSRHGSLGRAVVDLASFIADHRDEDDYFEKLAGVAEEEVERASDGTLERWVRALSEGLPRHFEHSDILFNTQQADREALASWRRRVKDDLYDVVVVGLAGALAVILYVVALGVRRHQEHARHLRDVDAEFSDDLDEVDAERVDTAENEVGSEGLRVFLLGVVAMSAFVMFGLGLLLILSYL